EERQDAAFQAFGLPREVVDNSDRSYRLRNVETGDIITPDQLKFYGSSGSRVGRTVSRLRNKGCHGPTRRRPYRAVLLPVRALSVIEQRRRVDHAPRPQALYPH